MSKVDESNLVLDISSINDYIDNFELERKSGTKALKKKFHKEAVEGRNAYVRDKIEIYEDYKKKVLVELENRCNVLLPLNKNSNFEERKEKLKKLQDLLIYTNKFMSNNFKLGFYDLIYAIKEETSLSELNIILEKFQKSFEVMNVTLTIEDFKYTMFTEDYFNTYFETTDQNTRKKKFEKVYWECPEIVLEIRQNLLTILKKYEKQIKSYIKTREDELTKENEVELKNIEEVYTLSRKALEEDIENDDYNILRDFIQGKHNIDNYLRDSATRNKIYDSFVVTGSYQDLSVEDKLKFKDNIIDLYNTLRILKKYYKYEYIVTDLVEKYNARANIKTTFQNIEKELDKDNKDKDKLYKEYQKSCGKGLFAKENVDKQNINKVKMNELFDKIMTDFTTYDEAKISMNLDANIKDGSNVHELFNVALSSYSYLVRALKEINKEELNVDIEKEIDDYIDFVYDPSGSFLDGIFVFNKLDITETVSNKYKLLGLNISTEKVSKDGIDSLLNDVALIYLIQNIENNILSMENIKFICDYNKIKPLEIEII